jgi:hypothetical protein
MKADWRAGHWGDSLGLPQVVPWVVSKAGMSVYWTKAAQMVAWKAGQSADHLTLSWVVWLDLQKADLKAVKWVD